MFRNLIEGGIYFMLPIYLMWVINIILTGIIIFRFSREETKSSTSLKPLSELVLFLGSFAFLFGVLGQIIGLIQALQVIPQIPDVSPALLAGGFRVSLLAPAYGFVLLLISYAVWFVTRRNLRLSN
ncbi:MAG: MotA/TolQ/ExbB proton channel family protein [Bacteroidales bacterium]